MGVDAEMYSVGVPVPFLIRVFSTLNAPGPYAVFLIFAVLIGLPAPQRWKFVALALGLTALLLTKTRSAWAAFLLGALVLQLRQPLRNLPRQWIALAVVLLLAAPAITHPRVMRAVAGRAASLASIEDDRSYRERLAITNYVVGRLKHNVVGDGLGRLGGAGKLQVDERPQDLRHGARQRRARDLQRDGLDGRRAVHLRPVRRGRSSIVRERRARRDAVANGAAAAAIAILAAAFFGNVFNGVSGVMFWSAVGFADRGEVVRPRRGAGAPIRRRSRARRSIRRYARHFTAA